MRSLAAVTALLCAIAGRASTLPAGWTVEPRSGLRPGDTISVTVSSSADSGIAHGAQGDTVVLLLRSVSAHGVALRRVSMHGTVAGFQVRTTIPDSAAELTLRLRRGTRIGKDAVDIDIALPAARYAMRSVTGIPAADSDLQAEITKWGDPFVGIYKFHQGFVSRKYEWVTDNDSINNAVVRGLLTLVASDPSGRPARYVLLAQLVRDTDAIGSDSIVQMLLDSAFRTGRADPIYEHNEFLWRLAAPVLAPDGPRWPKFIPRGMRAIARVAPTSTWAREWLTYAWGDTILSKTDFQPMLDAWRDSRSAAIVGKLGLVLANPDMLPYNPSEALEWLSRAIALTSGSATERFEDDDWDPSLLSTFLVTRAKTLVALGRPIEAISDAERAIAASAEDDRVYAWGILLDAATKAGFDSTAMRAYAMVSSRDPNSAATHKAFIDGHRRQGESFEEFDDRMLEGFGDSVLPEQLPQFSFTVMNGDTGSLAGLRGKVVMIDCWEIGCVGCVAEEPALKNLCASFGGDSVAFLSIARDSQPALATYLRQRPHCMPVVANGSALLARLGVSSYPTHFIIGHDGKTLAMSVGGGATYDRLLGALIRRALRRAHRH